MQPVSQARKLWSSGLLFRRDIGREQPITTPELRFGSSQAKIAAANSELEQLNFGIRSMNTSITLGIIVGNRGFFPAHLCDSGRKQILATLEKLGIGAVILDTGATKFGAVESMNAAQKCAELFKANAQQD